MGKGSQNPLTITVLVNSIESCMEIDRNLCFNNLRSMKRQLFPDVPLSDSPVILKMYTQEKMALLGVFNADAQHNGQNKSLTLHVIEGNGINLFGHEWLEELRINWKTIFLSTTVSK